MPTGTLTISQYTANPPQQVDANSLLEVRGWYSRDYISIDGVTPILGNSSNGEQGPYYSTTPSLNVSGEVVVPAHDVQITVGANPTANYFEGLWVDGAFTMMLMPNTQGATGWQIPSVYGDPIAYDEIATYNRARRLVYPPDTYFTADETIQEIERLAGNFDYMAVGVNGIGRASFPPVVASQPIVLMENDPRVGSYVNVLSYSAVGDGVTNNHAAFVAADAAAVAIGAAVYIPAGTFLTTAITFSSPVVFASGGIIKRTSSSITFNQPVYADPLQQIFDAAGTATITLKKNGWLSVYWFGASGTGLVDDTLPVRQAIVSANNYSVFRISSSGLPYGGAVIYLPPGVFKITDTLTFAYAYPKLIGEGPFVSLIDFEPGADKAAVVASAGASSLPGLEISGIGFYSSDLTHTKIAIDVYDISNGSQIRNIQVFGAGTGAANFWTGGTGSIGIRTHGRDVTTIDNILIAADRCVVIAANPNTAPDICEDMDHWNWNNCYFVGKGLHPLVEVDAGLGMANTKFGGYQAWTGGAGGFKINDTRINPSSISHDILFENVRTEQGTDLTKFGFDMNFVNCLNVAFQDVEVNSATQGFSLTGINRITFNNVIAAQAPGQTALFADPAGSADVIEMSSCTWQKDSVVNLTSYVLTSGGPYNVLNYEAPSNAVYTVAPNPAAFNLDFRFNASGQGGTVSSGAVRQLKWSIGAVDFAAGVTQTLVADVAGQGIVTLRVTVTGVGGAIIESGTVSGTATTLKIESGTTNFAITDTASKLCLFYDGSGNLVVKNRTVSGLAVDIAAEGRME